MPLWKECIGTSSALHRPPYVEHSLRRTSAPTVRLGTHSPAEYLKGLERRIASLYKFIKKHPATRIDLAFWADVTERTFAQFAIDWEKSLVEPPCGPSRNCMPAGISRCLRTYTFISSMVLKIGRHQRLLDGVSWGSVAGRAKVTISGLIDIFIHCLRGQEHIGERAAS